MSNFAGRTFLKDFRQPLLGINLRRAVNGTVKFLQNILKKREPQSVLAMIGRSLRTLNAIGAAQSLNKGTLNESSAEFLA